MNKKVAKNIITRKIKIIEIFLILSIIAIVLFSTLFSYIYNLNYYDKKYEQYGVYQKFDRTFLLEKTKELFDFFKNKGDLDTSFYYDLEISHLNDVKEIIQKARSYYTLSLIVFWAILIIYYIKNKKDFIKIFLRSITISGGLILMLMLFFLSMYFVFGFDILFIQFHKIFFTGNWMFDPNISNMKSMFPDAFFLDMSRSILLSIATKSLFMAIFGYFVLKKQR